MEELWINVRLATMVPGPEPYGRIDDGALAVSDGRIAWVGKAGDLPAGLRDGAYRVHDGEGRWVTPGLVDCHTHLVYAGSRAAEFEQRLQGVSYEEIARQGGGILSTVRATRAAELETLVAQSLPRLRSLMAEGVTTVEIKSGYGLEPSAEFRQLAAAAELSRRLPVTVVPTFLGAHALPPEYDDADDYIDAVCGKMLPEVARRRLAAAVDAFCERIAFTPAQTARVFEAARGLGLSVKLHADQLSDGGGAALAARYGALSADHLEYTGAGGIAAMAAAGTVAVLLPGAFYFLRETRVPPVDGFRRAGVPMAVASDSNPGSCPAGSLLLMLNMACTLFGLTPEEALAGATCHAARALGRDARIGTLSAGKDADFVLWDIAHPAELSYGLGVNPCHTVVRRGRISEPSPR